MTGCARLTVDLDALAANYRLLSQQVAPAKVAGVVKADGYGLDAKKVTDVLLNEGCRSFFVALLCEATALKPALPADVPIAFPYSAKSISVLPNLLYSRWYRSPRVFLQ